MVTRPSPTHIFSLLNFNPLVLNVIHIFRLNTSLSCVGDTRWNDRTTVSSKLYSKSWSTPTNYVDFSTFSSTELLWNIRFIYSTLYQWTTCRDILISIKKNSSSKIDLAAKCRKSFVFLVMRNDIFYSGNSVYLVMDPNFFMWIHSMVHSIFFSFFRPWTVEIFINEINKFFHNGTKEKWFIILDPFIEPSGISLPPFCWPRQSLRFCSFHSFICHWINYTTLYVY